MCLPVTFGNKCQGQRAVDVEPVAVELLVVVVVAELLVVVVLVVVVVAVVV